MEAETCKIKSLIGRKRWTTIRKKLTVVESDYFKTDYTVVFLYEGKHVGCWLEVDVEPKVGLGIVLSKGLFEILSLTRTNRRTNHFYFIAQVKPLVEYKNGRIVR